MKSKVYFIVSIFLILIGLITFVIDRVVNVEFLFGGIFFMYACLENNYQHNRSDIHKDGRIYKFDERSELLFYKSRAKVNVIIQNFLSLIFLVIVILNFINISFPGSNILMLFSLILYITISTLNIYINKKLEKSCGR